MLRRLVCLFACALALAAADGEQQLAHIGDLKLQSGDVIRDCIVAYRTFGTWNAQRNNAILFPTWFTGRSSALSGLIGPGKLADSSRFFVIAVDALGDGVSSSPSNSALQPRMKFPAFTIGDMVESQHRLLTGTLHLDHLYAVMGISMGGMQTFQWITAYPDFMDKAVPIVGSTRLTGADLLLWTAEERAIENSSDWKDGNYESKPAAAMAAVGAIHRFALTTPENLVASVKRDSFASFLSANDKDTAAGFDANDWLRQLEAMLAHNIAAPFHDSMEDAARAVKARVLVVASKQDHMVNPAPAIEFARLLNAELVLLDGACGHLATGCEAAKMSPAVSKFLEPHAAN